MEGGGRHKETVEQLLDRWLDGRQDLRGVTVKGYRDVLVPVRQRLGARLVRDLGADEVVALARWMAEGGGRYGKGLSPRTVEATLGAFGQAMDLALQEGTVECNVARAARRSVEGPGRRVPEDARPWSPQELAAFRARALADRMAGAWLLSLAGFRRAEVLGLHWSDVQLGSGTVRVERGRVSLGPGQEVEAGPTHSVTRRTVPVGMLPGIVPALRAMHDLQAAERSAAGTDYILTGFVVVDSLGRPPRPWWYSERFQSLCREAGVPAIPLDATRRLAQDAWRSAEAPEACIAEWLGTGLAVGRPTLRAATGPTTATRPPSPSRRVG